MQCRDVRFMMGGNNFLLHEAKHKAVCLGAASGSGKLGLGQRAGGRGKLGASWR